ncbi:N-acetyltransferase [Actinoplanes sp. DH11]|uniref:GNAT family N-acetyltransferase n=1 Tax=Actinoplanes sp. DH11 TaxID=2857011 RepID=UPI001E4B2663|nr:GNAT family N-acetyltransferase [Actinoplanes sp. DH11]
MRRLGPDDWRTWRDMRLAALTDAPRAFGSSWAKEQGYAEADWRAWLAPARGLKVVAEHDAGMVGAWVPADRGGAVELYTMWVRPEWRGRGVAGSLISEVLDWARAHDHPRVDLWVTGENAAAERLYRRHGFTMTAETQPHPAFDGLLEHLMTRPAPPAGAPSAGCEPSRRGEER